MQEKRRILGLTEKVIIIGNNRKGKEVIARIDTGATNSSIDREIAERLELGPIKKTKLVKSASGKVRRAVITARLRLDDQELEDEFTVAERKHLSCPVLLGQNLLKKGNFLIDPNKN